jgi:hypothetical protein
MRVLWFGSSGGQSIRQPLQQPPHLRVIPTTGPDHGGDTAFVKRGRDAPQRCNTARPQIRDDWSEVSRGALDVFLRMNRESASNRASSRCLPRMTTAERIAPQAGATNAARRSLAAASGLVGAGGRAGAGIAADGPEA